jgi:hypothetical protein
MNSKPQSNQFKAVSLQFSNVHGNDPSKLPLPGEFEVLGVRAPKFAADGTTYMLSDGTIWTYNGISGCAIDNKDRVNGWEMIWEP